MSKRGRKPVPTSLKIARGNPGKRPIPKDEIKYVGKESVQAPAFLGEHGVAMFEKNLAMLKTVEGLFQEADVEALALYCQSYEDFLSAKKEVDENGTTYTLGTGAIVAHPAVARKERAMDRMLKIAAKFGWTPSDRVGLNVGKLSKSEEDPFADWANGIRGTG